MVALWALCMKAEERLDANDIVVYIEIAVFAEAHLVGIREIVRVATPTQKTALDAFAVVGIPRANIPRPACTARGETSGSLTSASFDADAGVKTECGAFHHPDHLMPARMKLWMNWRWNSRNAISRGPEVISVAAVMSDQSTP